MTSPDQLIPGRAPPEPMEMQRVGPASASLLASTYTRIGIPHHFGRRCPRSSGRRHLLRPGAKAWIARVRGEVAGMIALKAEEGDEAEIVVVGFIRVRGEGLRWPPPNSRCSIDMGGRAPRWRDHQTRVVAHLIARPPQRPAQLPTTWFSGICNGERTQGIFEGARESRAILRENQQALEIAAGVVQGT